MIFHHHKIIYIYTYVHTHIYIYIYMHCHLFINYIYSVHMCLIPFLDQYDIPYVFTVICLGQPKKTVSVFQTVPWIPWISERQGQSQVGRVAGEKGTRGWRGRSCTSLGRWACWVERMAMGLGVIFFWGKTMWTSGTWLGWNKNLEDVVISCHRILTHSFF